MRDRFDIDQVIKITGLGIHAEQADGGADFDVACQIAVKKLWKIKEYESLEEQNRLLKLPCAVRDTVYIVKGHKVLRNYVVQIHIAQVEAQTFFSCYDDCFSIEQIGKTVFLTREEAESALKDL